MKRILALVLTLVMLFSLASCDFFSSFQGSPNENTTPEVTASTPENTTPRAEVTTPESTTPEGTTPEETTPEETVPGGTTPEIEVSLPEVSKVIANIIGAVAASVEVSDDAQFVFVSEQNSEVTGSNGYKQVMFFEVAEAVVNSDSELLKAHLKIKIGEAEVEIPYGVSSKDIVVGKDAITSYFIFEISVNGEDVSFTVNDQNASAKLSETVYGAIAQMMGLEGIDDLENLVMTVAIAQELEKNLMPIIAKVLEGTLEDLPTVSPAYIEHIEALFTALGKDIMTVTTDDVTGNTNVRLNIAALKKLLEEVEGKTIAEYLEGVYGENVANTLSSFLKSLPDKKVKEIVDAAVTLAEESGVSVQDIYALIDLYIYTAAGVEFSIEEQINSRYNNTLAELLTEFNDMEPETLKNAFVSAADILETASIDALLSAIFMDTEEGFIEALKAVIDVLDEQIVYDLTVDANGCVVAFYYGFGDLQYSLVVEGDDSILTVSMPDGLQYVVTVYDEGFNVVVMQNGEFVAAGSMTVTEEIIGEDTVSTVVIDLRDDENDLLDYTAVLVNGTLTMLDAAIRGYDVWYDGSYDEVTGEKFEVKHEEFTEFLVVEYTDLGEGNMVLNLYSSGNIIQITQVGDELTLCVVEGDTVIATGSMTVTDEIVNGDTVTTVVIDLHDSENDLLDYTAVSVNGAITQIDVVVRDYEFEYDWYYDEEINDWVEVEYEVFGEVFQAGVEFIDNEEGEDFICIAYQGAEIILGYKVDEDGVKFAVYNGDEVIALYETVVREDGSVVFTVVFGPEGYEVYDVTVTLTAIEGGLVIDIDLDHLDISDTYSETIYAEFDGTITIKVA